MLPAVRMQPRRLADQVPIRPLVQLVDMRRLLCTPDQATGRRRRIREVRPLDNPPGLVSGPPRAIATVFHWCDLANPGRRQWTSLHTVILLCKRYGATNGNLRLALFLPAILPMG